uniref:Uncharacterized protein n=1 Tax=Arcella intermedia TaxID=1963864 RepID=A0A6B2LFA0_9EUKA
MVLLGNDGIGKSALTVRFAHDIFIERYDPSIEDYYRKLLTVDGISYMLDILDTVSLNASTSFRTSFFKNSKGIILAYSVTSEESFLALDGFRNQVLQAKGADTVPVILCGTQCDKANHTVSKMMVQEKADLWGCPSIETSSRCKTNVDQVFIDLIREITKANTNKPAQKKQIFKESKKEKEIKKEEEMEKEKEIKKEKESKEGKAEGGEMAFSARKAILEDLLRDGLITSSQYDHYIQKNKLTFGLN